MAFWPELLQAPEDRSDGKAIDAWFARIAEQLLNGTRLVADKKAHRILEVEFYYRSPEHLDLFAHAQPIQLNVGRWYFHMTGKGYRGGSYKGIDLTFGDANAYAGILIRTIEKPDGSLINGPSLIVDHLLRLTKQASVKDLVNAIGTHKAWSARCPVSIQRLRKPDARPFFRTAAHWPDHEAGSRYARNH